MLNLQLGGLKNISGKGKIHLKLKEKKKIQG